MILFCEECGQRNSITLTPALIETNSFTCQFCRFKSPFPFLDKNKNSTSASAVIRWQPEELRLPAAAESQEHVFQLRFEVGGVEVPQLTVEPFRHFAKLLAVEKTGPASFSVSVRPLGKSKGLPPNRKVPALIFCEENIMSWGTIALVRDPEEAKTEMPDPPKEDCAGLAARRIVLQPPPPEEEKVEASEDEDIPPENLSIDILHQQLAQHKAQLHQARTASFRMQKELSIRRQVMDSQSCGILFVSSDQQVLYANPIFLSRCGCTLSAVQNRRLDQLIKLVEPEQNVEEALSEAETKGSWQGKAILLAMQEEQQCEPQPSTISITRSEADGEGKEKGFICLLLKESGSGLLPPCACPAAFGKTGFGLDALTGLADRPSFQEYLEDSIALLGEESKEGIALLYVDLDHFKRINRIFGPGFGDKILCSVATILKKCAHDAGADLVARLSGDEFAVILPPPASKERAKKLAERIMERFRTPVNNESRAILIRPSIGFSVYPDDGGTPLELLRNADTAMEAAKGEGGNRICQWDSGMKIQAAESLYLENDLRKAVADDELINYYQPQVSLTNGSICGMEALARWIHPTRGMISPAAFIPIAENTGLIEKLGLDLVRKACAQGKKWRDMGFKRFIMAVNLSGRLLRRRDLYYQIMSCIESTGYPPEALEVEFTEGVLIENMDFTVELINKLRDQGVKTAIDDFGTGYSSLSYLQHLRVDKIKIDRSFITNVTTNRTDAAITLGIISIAKNLGFRVIAEGIETEDHLFFLQKSRCDEGQGYLFSTPISEKDMTSLLLRDSSVALSHKRMIDKFYSVLATDKRKS
ncbi:MAG: putative bifunctional diguanylate cyclase/phosphodiesterase [Candidatus Electronema sp. V4]|uniref:putative bifunctional diguanylate cyclase/phosphodiesterase n=1 Tax=Candidatus Electronema sp. V4 TaxID=3454756 RepID=UPI0040559988